MLDPAKFESGLFSEDTFHYFDQAFQFRDNSEWFELNQSRYLNHVKDPFFSLIEVVNHNSDFQISKNSLSRPKRKYQTQTKGYTKDFCKVASPNALHFQLGRKEDDNYLRFGSRKYQWNRAQIISNDFLSHFLEILNG